VMAVGTPVMALDDVLVTMLGALDEHALDYGRLLAITRAVREQIGWDRLRAYAIDSPYAKAFLTLVEELGIAPRPEHRPANGHSRTPGASPSRVRVLGAAE
jgi:hypothetical protein